MHLISESREGKVKRTNSLEDNVTNSPSDIYPLLSYRFKTLAAEASPAAIALIARTARIARPTALIRGMSATSRVVRLELEDYTGGTLPACDCPHSVTAFHGHRLWGEQPSITRATIKCARIVAPIVRVRHGATIEHLRRPRTAVPQAVIRPRLNQADRPSRLLTQPRGQHASCGPTSENQDVVCTRDHHVHTSPITARPASR